MSNLLPSSPPPWPHCGRGADSGDPVGCRGRAVEPHGTCLAHLHDVERAAYLASLSPGSDLDHRGTVFTRELLGRLLTPLVDPATTRPRLGEAHFEEATFRGEAEFGHATFSGTASFDHATFSAEAGFYHATFCADAGFYHATFSDHARFGQARFSGHAGFGHVTFSADAGFSHATFSAQARFYQATFSADVEFDHATFRAHAGFDHATFRGDAGFGQARFFAHAGFFQVRFETAAQLGPLVCRGRLDLTGAWFGAPVSVEAAAARVHLQRSRWGSTATVRLRYATVDLRDAVLEYPVSISARASAYPSHLGPLDESPLSRCGYDPGVRITSISGVDATHLVVSDVDLSDCQFSGVFHLDLLRLEGRCVFGRTPTGWHRQRQVPKHWTPRVTLAEEQHWRTARQTPGWNVPAPEDAPVPGPAALARVYRHLRKSLEDSKNEPDAADFYYGECEMRRHDTERPTGERALLFLYWAVSGYGLRASRALAWLLIAMTVTVSALMLWGLPQTTPAPTTRGTLTHGHVIRATTDTPAPAKPTGPYLQRITGDRWERSLRIVLESVVFRSSEQDLTTAGAYIQMASRAAEPVLLIFAIWAIRGRVKR
ncbi:pentapeptide repeat-containing protein [Wenjunlia vitaminophila]|uniref:pentapeptide repeat-containing protein n=1 Tax=Wenjunlia vitaminophila TaxID=76728 RepID=UPI00036CD1D7|nr:pentapeptide repeat-containing protein [Wenjunlia vitaminophila]